MIQSYSSSTQTWIKCEKNSTLIVFGKDIYAVPKRPEIPPGYEMEQLLAIGLIMEEKSNSITSVVFYWFLTENLNDLFNWINAFRTSLIPKPTQSGYDKEEQKEEDTALGILMAGANYQAIAGCNAYDTSLNVAPDFNDYTFSHDFSFCSGL